MKNPDALPGIFLASVHEHGYAGTLREWGNRLGNLDDFGGLRLRELLAAAEQFDATGARSPDAFADHVMAYQVKAGAAAGTVRVMTVHQAKGLGFDLVIVPFAANARSFEKPGDPDLLAGDDWILDPPSNQPLQAAGGAPCRALDAARADANFAQLCVLYVALTRAQRALYMIVPEKGKSANTVREADLLRERLAAGGAACDGSGGLKALFAAGDHEWFKQQREAPGTESMQPPAQVRLTYAPEIARREPSKEQGQGHSFPAEWLFGIEAGDVRAFGSAIHRLFQKIEWLEDADVEAVVAEWRSESSETPAFLADVERQFRSCLTNDTVRRRLARPSGAARAEVWREAPFNLALESEGAKYLVSGRFDRLVIERNAAGKAVKAHVFDFKSNRVDTEAALRKAAEGYASQMSDYARAACRLLALPPGQVTTTLLFTRAGWMWP